MTTPSKPDLVALADLRSANKARQAEWDQDNQITLAYRGNELAGEVGEACNVIKKLERERLGIRGSRATKEQLAEELADVVICADLIAMDAGIDLLNEAVPAKFNATSEKVGLNTRLASQPSLYEAGLREFPSVVSDAMVQAAAEAMKQRRRSEIEHSVCRATYAEMAKLMLAAAIAALPADGGANDIQSSDGGVEGHAIPRTTSATTTRYPETGGEEHMVATARRTEAEVSTKTGLAGIKPGPSEATPSTAGSIQSGPTGGDAVNARIGGTEFCGHGVMKSLCPTCSFKPETPVLVYVPAALSAPVETPVAVKPLEWTVDTKHYMSIHCGRGLGLLYQAAAKCYSSGWVVTLGEEVVYNDNDGDEEAAKAAAQADYEQRIRSALIDTPVAAGVRDGDQRCENINACLTSAVTSQPNPTTTESGNGLIALVTELPESVRIPLHSLQADLEYLIGRVIADASSGPMIVKSIKERLDLVDAALASAGADKSSDGGAQISGHSEYTPVTVRGSGPSEATTEREPPEWLWWGEVNGTDVVTFGRWPKHGARWRYKLADIQPTEHDHAPSTDQRREEIAREAIPAGIYFNREHDNFYDAKTNAGMGEAFYFSWVDRWCEFPSCAEAALDGGDR